MTLDERARIAVDELRSSLDRAAVPEVRTIRGRVARRRVARLLGSGVALVALGLAASQALHTGERDLAIDAGDQGDDDGDNNPRTGPKVVVAEGDWDGTRWQLEVYRSKSGVCVDLRYQDGAAGGCGLDVPPRGVGAVHARVGSGEAVFGAVQTVVTRVEAVRASGARSVVVPTGANEGFGIAFYAFVGSDEDPIETVIAYDAQGDEVDRIAADRLTRPSQSPADAQRDGVIAELAALTIESRAETTTIIESPEGTWALARPPESLHARAADRGCLFGPVGGTSPDVICIDEYGEVLLLNARGEIDRAYPMPAAPPNWIHLGPDAVYAGHIGDGGLPNSTLVRIDRNSLTAQIVVFPQPDSEVAWPTAWHTANETIAGYPELVRIGPDETGTIAVSEIGRVAIDTEAIDRFFRAL